MSGGGRPLAVDVSRGLRRTAAAEDRPPVDPCDFEAIGVRLADAAVTWFFLRTTPGAEFQVVTRLARLPRPIFAAAPIEHRWHWANGAAERKTLRVVPAIPGYVIVAQPREFRAQRWVALLTCEGVQAPLGARDGAAPAPVPPEVVRRFVDCSSNAPVYGEHMRTREEFAAGDAVEVADPRHRLHGEQGVAQVVQGETTRALLWFLGAMREVTIPTAALARRGS